MRKPPEPEFKSCHIAGLIIAAALSCLLWLHPLDKHEARRSWNGVANSVFIQRFALPAVAADTGPPSSCIPTDDESSQRNCGWQLFNTLFDDGQKDPMWRNASTEGPWYTKCDMTPALSAQCNSFTQNQLGNAPLNLRQVTSRRHRADPVTIDPPLPTIFYNSSAAMTIQNQQLGSGVALQQIIKTSRPNEAKITFPNRDEIVVKEIWEAIPVPTKGSKKNHGSFVSIYDSQDESGQLASPHRLGTFDSWPDKLQLKMKNKQIDFQTSCNDGRYAVKKNDSKNSSAVPINCFYYRTFGDQKCEDSVGATSTVTVWQPDLPCVAVLVGFHIITHTIPTWTWSTFWWENDADADTVYHRDHPKLRNPNYSHYVMSTSFGPAYETKLPTILNPYLEGTNGDLNGGNCFICHESAAYVPTSAATGKVEVDNIVGQDLQIGAMPKPCPSPNNNPIKAQCPLMTSFLYSIEDNQIPPSLRTPELSATTSLKIAVKRKK